MSINNKYIKYAPIILSLLALTLSIIAFCRTDPITIDLFGVSVGVLSLLVGSIALMLGYNIFILESKIKKELFSMLEEKEKKLYRILNEEKTKIEKSIEQSEDGISGNLFFRTAELGYATQNYHLAFHNYLYAIDNWTRYDSSLETITVCVNRLKSIIDTLNKGHDKIKSMLEDRDILISIISSLKRNDTKEIMDYVINEIDYL